MNLLFDLDGTLRSGVAGAGVLWGFGSRDELTAAGARALVEAPADLVRMLDA